MNTIGIVRAKKQKFRILKKKGKTQNDTQCIEYKKLCETGLEPLNIEFCLMLE